MHTDNGLKRPEPYRPDQQTEPAPQLTPQQEQRKAEGSVPYLERELDNLRDAAERLAEKAQRMNDHADATEEAAAAARDEVTAAEARLAEARTAAGMNTEER